MSQRTFWPNGSRTSRPRITNAFGVEHPRYSLKPHPAGGYRRWHTGDDTAGYDLNCSPADGVVVFAGYDGSYGNTVIVDHDGVARSRTAHGSRFLVRVGDRVVGGQPLLVQASTGMSTGKHNHQEIILPGGRFVAPSAWISARIAAEIAAGIPAGGGSTPFDPEEDEMSAETEAMIRELHQELLPGKAGVKTQGRVNKVLTDIHAMLIELPTRVWAQPVRRGGKNISALQELADAKTTVLAIAGRPAADVTVDISTDDLSAALAPLLDANQATLIAAIRKLPKDTVAALKAAL